jgi:hypothetical protein
MTCKLKLRGCFVEIIGEFFINYLGIIKNLNML